MSRNISMTRAINTTDQFKESAGELFPVQGWGVFARYYGISGLDCDELRAVRDTEIEAKEEAQRLDENEGYVEHEVSGDPDTSVYSGLSFFAAQVALNEVTVVTCATAQFERV